MRLFIIIICALLLICFSSAHASETRDDRNKFYLGASVGSYQDVLEDDTLGGSFQIGYDLHKFIAIESQLGLTYDTYEETVDGSTLSSKNLISYASIYLRGNLRFDSFSLFALGGYSYVRNDFELDISPPLPFFESMDGNTSDSDVSYGAGIDLYGNDTTALSFKWMRIIDMGDEGELDAWLLGFTHYLKN
jgi:hypothetical protein